MQWTGEWRETFRVTPAPDQPWYLSVWLYDTCEEMRASLHADGWTEGDDPELALGGCCFGVEHAVDPVFAVVHLPRDILGSGLVAHEMTHAAFRYMERLGLTVTHGPDGTLRQRACGVEETFCSVVEHLNAGFWTAYYATTEATGPAREAGEVPSNGTVQRPDVPG
jgi:hypothetical protein